MKTPLTVVQHDSSEIRTNAEIRNKLQSDVEAFLASGGVINEISHGVVAQPTGKLSTQEDFRRRQSK